MRGIRYYFRDERVDADHFQMLPVLEKQQEKYYMPSPAG